MKTSLALAVMLGLCAGMAQAHQGAHLHPHEGASWLTLVGLLGVIALAARGLIAERIVARRRGRE